MRLTGQSVCATTTGSLEPVMHPWTRVATLLRSLDIEAA